MILIAIFELSISYIVSLHVIFIPKCMCGIFVYCCVAFSTFDDANANADAAVADADAAIVEQHNHNSTKWEWHHRFIPLKDVHLSFWLNRMEPKKRELKKEYQMLLYCVPSCDQPLLAKNMAEEEKKRKNWKKEIKTNLFEVIQPLKFNLIENR